MSCCSGKVGNRSCSTQNVSDLSPRYLWGCLPLLQAPGYKKVPSALFHPTESNAIQIPDRNEKNIFLDQIANRNHIHLIRLEKVLTLLSCNWPPREGGNSSR